MAASMGGAFGLHACSLTLLVHRSSVTFCDAFGSTPVVIFISWCVSSCRACSPSAQMGPVQGAPRLVCSLCDASFQTLQLRTPIAGLQHSIDEENIIPGIVSVSAALAQRHHCATLLDTHGLNGVYSKGWQHG